MLMKNQILCAIAVIGLATGCAEWRKHMGASKENDQNVLTGGPITGTKLTDLPKPVRNTLKEQAPTAEVADIDKQTKDGQFAPHSLAGYWRYGRGWSPYQHSLLNSNRARKKCTIKQKG